MDDLKAAILFESEENPQFSLKNNFFVFPEIFLSPQLSGGSPQRLEQKSTPF